MILFWVIFNLQRIPLGWGPSGWPITLAIHYRNIYEAVFSLYVVKSVCRIVQSSHGSILGSVQPREGKQAARWKSRPLCGTWKPQFGNGSWRWPQGWQDGGNRSPKSARPYTRGQGGDKNWKTLCCGLWFLDQLLCSKFCRVADNSPVPPARRAEREWHKTNRNLQPLSTWPVAVGSSGWLGFILQELHELLLFISACNSSVRKLKYRKPFIIWTLGNFLCVSLSSNPMSRLCQDLEIQIALEKSRAVQRWILSLFFFSF